jgi:hypothetical protein
MTKARLKTGDPAFLEGRTLKAMAIPSAGFEENLISDLMITLIGHHLLEFQRWRASAAQCASGPDIRGLSR